MKYCLEFGVKGGYHVDNMVFDSGLLARRMAVAIVSTLQNDFSQRVTDWKVSKQRPRVSWENATHFVSLSAIDGVPRGAASNQLWKKD